MSARLERCSCTAETLIATGTSVPLRLPPARHVLEHPLQHELADRHDEAGLLRHVDEALRAHVAVGRMLPAQQRFECHDLLRLDLDDRLVVHVELAALQRGAQERLDGDALLQAPVHDGAEELEVVAAAVLGLVHGGVGVAQQLAHVRAVARVQATPMLTVVTSVRPSTTIGRGQRLVDAARRPR